MARAPAAALPNSATLRNSDDALLKDVDVDDAALEDVVLSELTGLGYRETSTSWPRTCGWPSPAAAEGLNLPPSASLTASDSDHQIIAVDDFAVVAGTQLAGEVLGGATE